MEKVLPRKVFWRDPMENASSWQCDDGVGDQGQTPGYAGVWWHTGEYAVNETIKQQNTERKVLWQYMSVSFSCFMSAVHACSLQNKLMCFDGQLEASCAPSIMLTWLWSMQRWGHLVPTNRSSAVRGIREEDRI
eukprot:1157391-Pelagomonas_calceolata.AAC.3